MSDQAILVTGAAGFIGFHVARLACWPNGRDVVGLDSLNHYYDPALKAGAAEDFCATIRGSSFVQIDLADRARRWQTLFAGQRFAAVIHLAAQAGVRHSIDHPHRLC